MPWATPQQDSIKSPNQSPALPRETPLSPIELQPQPPELPPDDTERVFIQEIRVEGVTLLPTQAIEEIIAPYRNRELRFSEMEEMMAHLTELYIQAGYINSQVFIPPQSFTDSTLILQALEARMESLRFEKDRWFSARSALPRIPLEPGDFVNTQPLERSLRIINENPDLKVKAILTQGKLPGGTDVIIVAQDRFPFHLTPFWDNLGRQSIGTLRYGLTSTHNNLLGFGDTNINSLHFTSRSLGTVNQYSVPIGPHGTQLGFDYAYSFVKLGGDLEPLDIRSSSHIFSPAVRQAFWKTDRFSLDTELAFDFKNIRTDLLDVPFQKDQLRVLRPSLTGYLNDRWGRTFFNQELGIGLNMLGGMTGESSLASKQGSGTKFFRMSGGLTRLQKLPLGSIGILRGRYQYSPDRLVSAEQLQIGGAFTVRGYTEGRQIGDQGYLLNAEWYVPSFLFPPKWQVPFTKTPVRQAIQVVGFTDFARVFTNKPIEGEMRQATLLGCGVGLRVQLTRFVVARVDLGFPLLRQDPDENRARLHFGLQSTLF